MNTIYSIQYLRALAALAVVCFHAAKKFDVNMAFGAAGVDIFFVISGFIMWVITQNSPQTPLTFLKRRIERLAPMYWIVTSIMIVGGILGLFPNMVLTAQHTFYSLFFIPHISPSNGEPYPILAQGWTLNYEMFFYAFFAAFLLVKNANMRLCLISLTFAALVIIGIIFEPQNIILKSFTRPIILEFICGMIIGQLWLKGIILPKFLAAISIIAALTGYVSLHITGIGYYDVYTGTLAVLLVLGFLGFENIMAKKPQKPILYIADWSYSIYLTHTLVISVLAKVIEKTYDAPPNFFHNHLHPHQYPGWGSFLYLAGEKYHHRT